MKSDIEIKDSLHEIIQGSTLENAIASTGGKLYTDRRPANSDKEDIVISVIDGQNGDFQKMTVRIDIHVQDIDRESDKIENAPRLRELSRMAIDLLDGYSGNDFRIDILKQPVLATEEPAEHIISNTLLFTHQTF